MNSQGEHIPPHGSPRAGIYRHYKGKEYQVLGMARHSETDEWQVVYRALYGDRGFWVRPLELWLEPVDPLLTGNSTSTRFSLIEAIDISLDSIICTD